jgi:hypothetical protein
VRRAANHQDQRGDDGRHKLAHPKPPQAFMR